MRHSAWMSYCIVIMSSCGMSIYHVGHDCICFCCCINLVYVKFPKINLAYHGSKLKKKQMLSAPIDVSGVLVALSDFNPYGAESNLNQENWASTMVVVALAPCAAWASAVRSWLCRMTKEYDLQQMKFQQNEHIHFPTNCLKTNDDIWPWFLSDWSMVFTWLISNHGSFQWLIMIKSHDAVNLNHNLFCNVSVYV